MLKRCKGSFHKARSTTKIVIATMKKGKVTIKKVKTKWMRSLKSIQARMRKWQTIVGKKKPRLTRVNQVKVHSDRRSLKRKRLGTKKQR
jgi:hypothetical protein